MKRHSFIPYILAACLAFAAVSCSKENAPDTNPRAVRFNAAIALSFPRNGDTRASNASWALNDRVGIRMFNTQGNTVTGYENRLYTVSDAATGTFVPAAGDIYYPVNGSNVGFMAYYPYKEGVADAYTVDITDQSNPAAIDLLYAKTAADYNKETTSVPLTFHHPLSKIILKTQAGAGITSLAGMSITLNGMPTTASFNLQTGVLGKLENPQDITLTKVTDGALYQALVIPHAQAPAIKFKFILGTETFIWTPSPMVFEAGKSYEWQVTVSRTGVSGITGSIVNWY